MLRNGAGRDSVVITGIGLATPLGFSDADILGACRAGRPAVREIPEVDGLTGLRVFGGSVPAFDVGANMRQPKMLKFVNRAVECGLFAARQAVTSAGLDRKATEGERTALFVASGQTALEYHTFFPALELAWADRQLDFKYLGKREVRVIDRYFSLRTLANGGLALLALELGAQGSASNHTHGDVAFATALNSAIGELEEERCDLAVAGAYDCLVTAGNFLAYEQAGLLCGRTQPSAYLPFDAASTGIALGEGSAFFVLERKRTAQVRGASIMAEIVSAGLTHDPCPTADVSWKTPVLKVALDAARLSSEDVDFVVAHGLGLPRVDEEEAGAWTDLGFGSRPWTALKGYTGYLGAATGAVELAIGLICSRRSFVPPAAGPIRNLAPSATNIVAGAPRTTDALHPVGLFAARSWGGQVSLIAVRSIGGDAMA